MHEAGIRPHIVERVMARRGKLHLFDTLDPQRTALVVVDMQMSFVAPGAPVEVPAARGIVAPVNRLAAGLRARAGTVVWLTHANIAVGGGTDWAGFFDRFLGPEIRARTVAGLSADDPGNRLWPEMDVTEGDVHVVKNRYSALIPGSSKLERVLRSLGIDTLLIAGTKTNICCETLARDAMMLDFGVVMVADACATLTDEEHRATLETVIQNFGDVLTVDETLARLGPVPVARAG